MFKCLTSCYLAVAAIAKVTAVGAFWSAALSKSYSSLLFSLAHLYVALIIGLT